MFNPTENVNTSAETGKDNISMLRKLRSIVDAFHADATKLHQQTFPTREEAANAAGPLLDEFRDSYPLDVAHLYGAEVRVGGEGVLVPNITAKEGKNTIENQTVLQLAQDDDEPLISLDSFDSKVGMITGIVSSAEETDEGFRPIVFMSVQMKDKITVKFPHPDTEDVILLGGFLTLQVMARMTNETMIEHPQVEEIERYIRSVGSFALESADRAEFVDEINRLRAALYREYDGYQDLKAMGRVRTIAEKCESYVQDGRCTDEEAGNLLTSLLQKNRYLRLKGRVTGGLGRESEVVERGGKIVDIFIQRDENDAPLAVIGVEGWDEQNKPLMECFVMRELESLQF